MKEAYHVKNCVLEWKIRISIDVNSSEQKPK